MANNEQIRKLIRQIVREEIQQALPQMIAEAFTGLIAEGLRNPSRAVARPARSLHEASYGSPEELEDYPTMGASNGRPQMDRSRLAALMGYGDMMGSGGQRNNLIVSEMVTEMGTPIPVDPRALPDHVIDALTKDYRPVMAAIAAKKNGG